MHAHHYHKFTHTPLFYAVNTTQLQHIIENQFAYVVSYPKDEVTLNTSDILCLNVSSFTTPNTLLSWMIQNDIEQGLVVK